MQIARNDEQRRWIESYRGVLLPNGGRSIDWQVISGQEGEMGRRRIIWGRQMKNGMVDRDGMSRSKPTSLATKTSCVTKNDE